VDIDNATCADLRRLATHRRATAFTVETSAGQRPPDTFLRAQHVAWMAAVGGEHLTIDVAVRRSADLRLLAPIADRIVSLRIRRFPGRRPVDLADLPAIPCLQSLAVVGGRVTGIGSLRSPGLQALDVRGALGDEEVEAIARIASLRELRVWPRGPRRIARFRAVRQITRLHTRASARVLEAFEGVPLTRLVLTGEAGRPALRAVGRFTSLRALDLVLHHALRRADLSALGGLTSLRTLALTWATRPPRLPPLPALEMFVAGAHVDRSLVDWMRAQPRLRTVHSPVEDSVLRPLLPRARPYTIGRGVYQVQLAPARAVTGLQRFLLPGDRVTDDTR